MQLCAIPSDDFIDIHGMVMQCTDPDMPELSACENRAVSQRLSNLVKNKLNGIAIDDFGDEVTIAELLCNNINKYVEFSHIEKVLVCIKTGDCLIEGIVNGFKL